MPNYREPKFRPEADRYLLANYKRLSIDEMCVELRKTRRQIKERLEYLGVL